MIAAYLCSMYFSDVVGQSLARQGLLNLWHSGKLPHALMLVGKEGTGGLALALAMAQYIFCENKQGNESCGTCAACGKVLKLAHPDLHLSFPTVAPKPGAKPSSKAYMKEFREYIAQMPYGSAYDWLQYINAENKQGNITADECRDIIDTLNLTAFEGGYKIQIIWRPEYLGKEGNILLKLIEEPPVRTLILMVAEDIDDVLKTILSRTQQVHLLPLTATEIGEALVARDKVEPRRAAQVAQLAEGSYAQALQLLRYTGNDLLVPLREWFNGIFTNNGITLNKWVEDMGKTGREQQKNFLLFTQQLLAHAMRMTLIPGYVPALPEDEATFAGKLAQRKFSPGVFQEMSEALDKTIYHIERNAHSKTQLLHLSIRMQYLIQGLEFKIYA
jgi:DNA polymerase-3 subunit delta'